MKKTFLFVVLFVSVYVHAQTGSVVPKKPAPSEGLVLDQTKTLTPEQEAALEQKLITYDRSTSNQIAVVLIQSLNGNSIEDVALEIGRTWGVGGQADKDNGVVILVAKNDKKVRIEVGYGLEGAVTDYATSSIIENNIRPNFRDGDYYRGLDEAVKEIMKAAEVRYNSGVGTSIDYLTANDRLDRANINLIIAKYDFVLRKKVLDYYSNPSTLRQ